MPYMFLIAECVACGATFTCNPELVPSIRVGGKREPICRVCHARWNEIHRTSQGLAPEEARPGAYEPQEVA